MSKRDSYYEAMKQRDFGKKEPSNVDDELELFQDAFYNWLLKNGVDLASFESTKLSSSIQEPFIAKIDMNKLKSGIMQYAEAHKLQWELEALTKVLKEGESWLEENEGTNYELKKRISELTKLKESK